MEHLNTLSASAIIPKPVTSYREVKIGDTMYRVTSIFKGEFHLKDALEDLTVRRVARETLANTEKS